jgi:hypothetical protein
MGGLRRFRFSFAMLVAVLAIVFTAGAAMNRTAMTAIKVQLKPGAEEPGDHHLLGVGGKDKLPDYELRFRSGDDWHTVGARRNQSAAAGLEFPMKEPWPLRKVEELRLVETDHMEDDVLEQLPAGEGRLAGKAFEFEIIQAESWSAGAQWVWDTAIGKAILLGITIGVAAVIFANLGF